ncbi:MAG: type II CAAX endopeptidase family protein [Acidimicrobiales bacterium]
MADPRHLEGRHLLAPPASPDGVVAREPRWGLGDAFGGWLIAYVAATLIGAAVYAAFGYAPDDDVPLWLIALTYPPLWLGFVGVPIWAAATKGNGWIRDFRVAVRWPDVPIGLAIGVAAQLVMVPLISLPILELTGKSSDDLSGPARDLADKAIGPAGAVLFLVIVGICAPLAEELFFRGLVLRSFDRRVGRWPAVALSALWFGITHFQPLQMAALVAAGALFAVLVERSGRLGPAVFAHMGFNLTTVVVLLWMT